jgi:hypothetical protein
MKGVKDLLDSERGVLCLALLMAATLLAFLGKLPVLDWLTFAKWLAMTLVVSKTFTGAVETWTTPAQQPPTASS